MNAFDGCKVFSATLYAKREALGEDVTHWLEQMRQRPGFTVVDVVVRQSSDREYHCLSIYLFFRDPTGKKRSP